MDANIIEQFALKNELKMLFGEFERKRYRRKGVHEKLFRRHNTWLRGVQKAQNAQIGHYSTVDGRFFWVF